MSIGPKTKDGRMNAVLTLVYLLVGLAIYLVAGWAGVLFTLAFLAVMAIIGGIIYLIARWVQNGE